MTKLTPPCPLCHKPTKLDYETPIDITFYCNEGGHECSLRVWKPMREITEADYKITSTEYALPCEGLTFSNKDPVKEDGEYIKIHPCVEEFAIYDRVLSNAEIKQLYEGRRLSYLKPIFQWFKKGHVISMKKWLKYNRKKI